MVLIGIKLILKAALKLKGLSLIFAQPIYCTLHGVLNLGFSGMT